MASEEAIYTVGELVKAGVLYKPLDGNHGGIHPKGNDFVESGIPFVMASDISNGQVDTKTCKFISADQASTLRKGFAITGDVLISHKATIGRTAIVGEIESEFIVLTPQVTYYRVKDTDQLNNRYLKYYFDSYEFQGLLNQWAGGGSTRAYLGITGQLKLPIKILDIQKQKAIAHILGSLDDKIELNRQMNATLEAMAQTLFKSWFVDFDLVLDNVLAAGNAIPDEFIERAEQRKTVEKKDNSDINHLFPDEFEFTEEMGWIPRGWSVQSFSELAVLDTTSVKPNLKPNKIWEHFSIPAFDIDMSPVSDRGEDIKSNKYKVDANAVLVSKLNPETERIWWVNIQDEESAICSTEFMQFIPVNSKYRAFIYSLVRSDYFQTEILSRVTGSTGSRQRAQPKSVAAIDILKPEEDVLIHYSNIVLNWKLKVSVNIDQNLKLAKLRDTLLPKLMSGELRIPDTL